MPQAPQQQFARVPEMPRVQMQGQQLDAALDAGLRAIDQYADLHDFGVRQETEHALRQNELEMQKDFERRSSLAPGAEGSFYTAEGMINEDAVMAFTDKWQQKNREISRPFWKRENAMRGDDDILVHNDKVASDIGLSLLRQESDRRAAVFRDNFDLAMAQNDTDGANRIVDDAVASGQITQTRGQLMKLQIGRSALRRRISNGGPINIGGTDYDGDSAALAIAAARDNTTFIPRDDDVSQAFSAQDLSLEVPPVAFTPDSVPAPGAIPGTAADFSAGGDFTLPSSGNTVNPVTLDAVTGENQEAINQNFTLTRSDSMTMPEQRSVPAPVLPGESWQQGDFAGIVRSLPMRDALSIQDSLSQNTGIFRDDLPDGSTLFSCRASANNATQRVVAVANKEGEINPETARSMVANIAISAIYDNPDATASSVVSMFEDSGVFEALGSGDPEIGRNLASGIVREFFERGKTGTTKLNLQAIQTRVNNFVSSSAFGKDTLWEWKMMESLRPPYNEDGRFDKPDDDIGRAHWFSLYRVYEKYRDEFNPKQAFKPLQKDEFEENAHAFYQWYMGKTYSKQKKEYQEAASDWYMARIGDALVDNLSVSDEGKAEYGSYASDLALVDSILDGENGGATLRMPRDFGVEAMREEARTSEKKLEDRRSVFRKKAEADYSAIRELKQLRESENQRKKEEKEMEKDIKKALDDLHDEQKKKREKAEENEMRRSIRRARMQTRNCSWVWDGKNDDSSPPFCYIPESEYRDLIEKMGYDGMENVYVRVNGYSIPVIGSTTGKYIRLNTAATMKVQAKSRSRRRHADNLQTRGTLGFTYSFSSSR